MIDIASIPPHRLLPQRAPVLMVDRIVKHEDGEINCIKALAYNEPYFAGHFPNDPVLPGVLLIEACAQASMLLAIAASPAGEVRNDGYLVDVRSFRVYRPSRPGDVLHLRAKQEERFGPYLVTKVTVTNDAGSRIASGRLSFYMHMDAAPLVVTAVHAGKDIS